MQTLIEELKGHQSISWNQTASWLPLGIPQMWGWQGRGFLSWELELWLETKRWLLGITGLERHHQGKHVGFCHLSAKGVSERVKNMGAKIRAARFKATLPSTRSYQCMCVFGRSACWTPLDPMDCSSPGSFAHGIFPAGKLESVATSSSGGVFQTQGSNPHLPCLLHCRQILYCWATGETQTYQQWTSIVSVSL